MAVWAVFPAQAAFFVSKSDVRIPTTFPTTKKSLLLSRSPLENIKPTDNNQGARTSDQTLNLNCPDACPNTNEHGQFFRGWPCSSTLFVQCPRIFPQIELIFQFLVNCLQIQNLTFQHRHGDHRAIIFSQQLTSGLYEPIEFWRRRPIQ